MSTGIFKILDDVAVLADDVASSVQIATKKTAGILGDDLAVSANNAVGFSQEKELKIIWEVIKGSLKNKLIIVPLAIIFSIYFPYLIPYILIAGALFLLFEGVEKIEEYVLHKFFNHPIDNKEILDATPENIVNVEKEKINSAIKTDFILSIEIVIIALNAVANDTIINQIIAVIAVSLIATFGVYGIVALIVRIDNLGLWFINKKFVKTGNFLISLMPQIIKTLSVVGVIAILIVGGEILIHNIPILHHNFEADLINSIIIGKLIGLLVLVVIKLIKYIFKVNR